MSEACVYIGVCMGETLPSFFVLSKIMTLKAAIPGIYFPAVQQDSVGWDIYANNILSWRRSLYLHAD